MQYYNNLKYKILDFDIRLRALRAIYEICGEPMYRKLGGNDAATSNFEINE